VARVMSNLAFIISNAVTTNKHAPKQPPKFINALIRMLVKFKLANNSTVLLHF
jgi:hypothetical protein